MIVNDKLNSLPVTIGTNIGQVKLSPVSVPTGLTLNADGTITVASSIPGGTYLLTYSICEVLNPNNCDTATATVIVSEQNPSIALIKGATAVDENNDGFVSVGDIILYNFTITNTGNVTLTNITISDLLPGLVLTGGPITLLPGQVDSTSFIGNYTITQADANNGEVVNQATVFATSPLGIIIEDLSDSDSNDGNGDTVIDIKNCTVQVSNALSPNGDGINDYLYIGGLDCYSSNTIEIYNRWGGLVFESKNYNNKDNVFEGISRGKATVGQSDELPAGTYFYLIKYYDDSGNRKQNVGYLYLSR